ncbi:MAG: geranylgeranyl diphosphate synthase, type, partial [Candidatus Eremiobacteraeota bacterium]|nr:geranylgeranyl diphosphate synthase, type [Candidatus Eremiobacteraeota bacterium]
MPERRHRSSDASRFFTRMLERYRDRTTDALLGLVPERGAPYLYDLVGAYPRRLGKGLRAALCLATCEALGGNARRALNSAVAIELFHNAFLIHDDVQDQSVLRRGGSTLTAEYGPAIAVNVGNAANVMALQRLIENRLVLGAPLSSRLVAETERMLLHTLEGQALELAWIRDNVCDLEDADYLHMCLKKTSWYSFIYPMRVGALIAEGTVDHQRFCRFGWYLGAAFQIQDDIL